MGLNEDFCPEGIESIRNILLKNTGKVVIIFTETGGCAGKGFTGLVSTVCDGIVKLITSIPSAPPSPFRGSDKCCDVGEFSLCCNHKCSKFGSAVLIPICKITSVVVAEV